MFRLLIGVAACAILIALFAVIAHDADRRQRDATDAMTVRGTVTKVTPSFDEAVFLTFADGRVVRIRVRPNATQTFWVGEENEIVFDQDGFGSARKVAK